MGVGVRFILGNMNTVAVNSNTVDVELRLFILRNSLHEIHPAQKFTQTTCKDKLTKHLTITFKKNYYIQRTFLSSSLLVTIKNTMALGE